LLNGFTDGLPTLPSTAATTATAPTAPTASTATAAKATATATATTTSGSLTRLVDGQGAALEVLAVEIRNGGLCAGVGRHLDKSEAARTPTFPIHDQLGFCHFVACTRE
jgi:hypothetical protein